MGEFVFYDSGLTTVTFEDGTTSILEGVFRGCSDLAVVNIPNTVTTIEDKAFYYCDIESIIIPNSVTKIGDYAFYDNDIDISYYCGSRDDWDEIDMGKNYAIDNAEIIFDYMPDDTSAETEDVEIQDAVSEGSKEISDDWVCPECGNNASGKFCNNCGTARPAI